MTPLRWSTMIAVAVCALGVLGADEPSCMPVPVMCAEGSACNDGDPCTENDVCGALGRCRGVPVSCEDDLACTEDACVDGACVHVVAAGWLLIGGTCYEEGTAPLQIRMRPQPSSFVGTATGGGMQLRARGTSPTTGTATGGGMRVRTTQ